MSIALEKIGVRDENLTEIMGDKGLAALGDAYVNLIYSLAKATAVRKPQGERVRSKVLSEALKNSGLRDFLLPKRLSGHELSNATESLIVYCWLNKLVSLDEAVSILSAQISEEKLVTRKGEWGEAVKAFTFLLVKMKERLRINAP